jgi:hypothetical protein
MVRNRNTRGEKRGVVMRGKSWWSAIGPAAGVLVFAVAASGQQQLDQEQLLYNGGMSARTLPGYTVWQSFTAGVSGTLTQIDMGFFNNMSGDGVLRIYAGSGTVGALLQTLNVPVIGVTQQPVTWNSWAVDVPVTAGLEYTFELTPNPLTLPDPYGVCVGAPNPYPGGDLGLNDPSGTYETSFDAVFRTWVTTATGACCNNVTGACTSSTQASCGSGSTYKGNGTFCSSNPCPQPAPGVCCRGATCNTTISQANCVAPGGGSTAGAAFTTSASACNAAGNRTTPCCEANYNKAGGVSVQDIFDFLSDWFAGSPFARVGGDGTGAAPTVQSVFDFLGAWFGGGCS